MASSPSPADTTLMESTMVGDVALAAQALQSGANPNYTNGHMMCPLLVCCGGSGPIEMLDLLITAGARVDCEVRVFCVLKSYGPNFDAPLIVESWRNAGQYGMDSATFCCEQWARRTCCAPASSWRTHRCKNKGPRMDTAYTRCIQKLPPHHKNASRGWSRFNNLH
jgi:hypothetical protein